MDFKLPSLGLFETWEHERAQSFATRVTLRHGFKKGLKCMMIRFPKYYIYEIYNIERPPLSRPLLSVELLRTSSLRPYCLCCASERGEFLWKRSSCLVWMRIHSAEEPGPSNHQFHKRRKIGQLSFQRLEGKEWAGGGSEVNPKRLFAITGVDGFVVDSPVIESTALE